METKQIHLVISSDLPSLNNGLKCRKPVFSKALIRMVAGNQ